MSSNPSQGALTDFHTNKCPVCGRMCGDDKQICHPTDFVTTERKLAMRQCLFPELRPEFSDSVPLSPVVGSDSLPFNVQYLTLAPLMQAFSNELDEYEKSTSYEFPDQPWIQRIYRNHHIPDGKLTRCLHAALQEIEKRIEAREQDSDVIDVLAHLVYLDQFGLLPGYDRLRTNKSIRRICSDHFGSEISDATIENSELLVRRRVDRAKVYSTTSAFRRKWDLEIHLDGFDHRPVVGDHRDHNLVTRAAKEKLSLLPTVHWACAPHSFYLGENSGSSAAVIDSSKVPTFEFDFAGFKNMPQGQKLEYLGIVADWDESNYEIYYQLKQLQETDALGIIVHCNRHSIYEFLHFLKTNELIAKPEVLPDTLDQYQAIPNVQALHDTIIREVPFLDGIVIYPRRKFLDETFLQIDQLMRGQNNA
ncbi:hypothetical protein OB955_00035 [Halobacteria archaeon AArc-m2/3/4]|uniref:Uncharacterized protein n=1 Tax=Natronoglomus mannanivorans TaxID=2979990 RepID=A0ABT2Q876_9EURY|nr:hypothetical protein [Halobacteria archaeon AArc-m2/3/4]